MSLDGFLVKVDRLTLDDGECAGGTNAYAESRAVTQLLAAHPCLSIDQLNRALGAGTNALPTTRTQLFVDLDDTSRGQVRLPPCSGERLSADSERRTANSKQ